MADVSEDMKGFALLGGTQQGHAEQRAAIHYAMSDLHVRPFINLMAPEYYEAVWNAAGNASGQGLAH